MAEKETKGFRVGDGTPGPGRPKGIPNKSTQEVRDAIARLMEHAAPKMVEWLDRIAQDDPVKAMDLTLKAAEYHIPKLARSEVTGADGGPLEASVKVKWGD